MKPVVPQNQAGGLPEWLQASLYLIAITLLFASGIGAPLFLSQHFGVWYGLGGAVVAIVCWVYLVRPMPGLGAGIIALAGLFALTGALIVAVVRVIKHLIA